MLGPLELDDLRGGAGAVERPKLRALLALLLIHANAAVSADTLVDELWDADAPRSARGNLKTYVWSLRRLLSPADPGASPIRTDPGGYMFHVARDDVDMYAFERLIGDGRTARRAGDLADADRRLGRALALWRGSAFEGVALVGTRLPQAVRRLEEQRLAAFEDLVDLRLAAGGHREIIADLRIWVERHPLQERLWGQLLLALYRDGRQADALDTYQLLRRRLVDEVGVEPGEALQVLHGRVLSGDPALAAPERIVPVAPGPATAAGHVAGPDPIPPAPVPDLLPPDIPDFTGRRDAVRALERLLLGDPDRGHRSAPAVAGVAGMGGIGKTALAVHVAHRCAAAFPDGQLYVNLRGTTSALDSAEVLARFVRALGVDGRSVPVDADERAALYRSRLAGRKMLVVLDDAASEAQIRPLLPGAATCAVLVTSRRRLTGVEGARWVNLDEMPSPEAVELLARVVGDDRVRHGPDDAAEIVRLCAGLPLAVRVIGARLTARPHWRLGHIVDMLGDQRHRLDRLATGDLEMRASLALSLHGLDDEARRLFRRLSLFEVPDFSTALAIAVAEGPAEAATHAVESLVDAQLLAVTGDDGTGQARYRFHDLVRLFARELSEREDGAADRCAAVRRGLGFWLAVAERMAERVPGPCYALIGAVAHPHRPATGDVPCTDPLAWFDAERLTLLSAVRQACELGLDDLAFGLAGALERYLDLRRLYSEWEATNEMVMSACRRAGNQLGEAVMLRGLIDVQTWSRQHSDGEAMLRSYDRACRLLEMFTALGETRGMADAAVMCSWALTAQGRAVDAVELAERALRLADGSGHLGGRARACVALAVAFAEQKRWDRAATSLFAGLEAARRHGNPRYEATVLQFLGIAQRELGELDASEASLVASLAITRRYHDSYAEALTMLALARLHAHRGDERATEEAEGALRIGREHGMGHHVAESLAVLGEIDLARGRPEAAVARMEESVAMWRTRGWLSFQAAALATLGRAYGELGRAVPASAALAEARDIYARLGQPEKVRELERLLLG
ncbi:BTAD domain-containing putative transcriptional regulator [Dactylosporangium sucinum]|uniref:SARP family transcriptional regulator n=1 Tax=Dactylosporangium sucinum TaxID=1424081 RepID=A0A917UBB6_9ACTN|nr:BTAD domain-containing putative transcriptional regulator [Dactylosporangium sucinum]GGM73028.1 SARP family transcriptional regulator [Dactylosporangium sucinum]